MRPALFENTLFARSPRLGSCVKRSCGRRRWRNVRRSRRRRVAEEAAAEAEAVAAAEAGVCGRSRRCSMGRSHGLNIRYSKQGGRDSFVPVAAPDAAVLCGTRRTSRMHRTAWRRPQPGLAPQPRTREPACPRRLLCCGSARLEGIHMPHVTIAQVSLTLICKCSYTQLVNSNKQ